LTFAFADLQRVAVTVLEFGDIASGEFQHFGWFDSRAKID
jgi:hypothetical protein